MNVKRIAVFLAVPVAMLTTTSVAVAGLMSPQGDGSPMPTTTWNPSSTWVTNGVTELIASPNPVPLPIGILTGTFDLSWSREGGGSPGMELHIQRSGQNPEPMIQVPDIGEMLDIPIAAGEVVAVKLTSSGGLYAVADLEVYTDQEVPQLECAVVICAFDPTVTLYPDWVLIEIGIENVRRVWVEISQTRDGTVVGRYPMELAEDLAIARIERLEPGTAYMAEFFVEDHFGSITSEAIISFEMGR